MQVTTSMDRFLQVLTFNLDFWPMGCHTGIARKDWTVFDTLAHTLFCAHNNKKVTSRGPA